MKPIPANETRIRDYVAAKSAVSQTLFRSSARGRFYVVNGKEIPEAEYMANNEVKLRPLVGSVENPDKTKLWQY